MAETFDNLIFGSEFRAADFIAGVDKAINYLTSFQKKNEELTASDAKLTKQLQAKKTTIDNLQKSLDALNRNDANYQQQADKLTSSIDKETKAYDNLQKKLTGVQQQLKETTAANDKVNESFGKAKTAGPILNSPQSPVNLTANTTAQVTKLQELKDTFYSLVPEGKLAQIFSDDEINRLLVKLKEVKGDFSAIGVTVDELTRKLLQLEPGTQQFEDVSEVVKAGNAVLEQYALVYNDSTKAVAAGDGVYKSARTRMLELRNELLKLEDAGKEETAEYRQKQIALAELTDQYSDMQQRVRILASDTKNLDFGVAVVSAAASSYQTYIGLLELTGASTEDAAEGQRKLLAVMSLVQGLQQLQNLLLKDNVIAVVGADLVSRAYASTQRGLAAAFGLSTVAARGFSAALVSTGIGALVVGIGYLISKLIELKDANEEAAAAQKEMQEITESAKDDYVRAGVQVANLKEKIESAKNGQISANKVIKEYNESIGKVAGEVKNLDEAEQGMINNADKYIEYTFKKALAAKYLEEAVKKQFEAQQEADKPLTDYENFFSGGFVKLRNLGTEIANLIPGLEGGQIESYADKAIEEQTKKVENLKNQSDKLKDLNKTTNEEAKALFKSYKNVVDEQTSGKTITSIQNVYEQKLKELKTKLTEATSDAFIDESIIRKRVQDAGNVMIEEINRLTKEKKLTQQQSTILTSIIGEINTATLTKDLQEFEEKKQAYVSRINDELNSVQVQESTKRIQLIQEEYERERQTILNETETTQAAIIKKRDEFIATTKKEALSNGFRPGDINYTQQVQPKIDQIKSIYGRMLDDLEDEKNQKLQKLTFDTFDTLQKDAERALKFEDAGIAEGSLFNIQKATNEFLAGKISYKEFQDEITQISNNAAALRTQNNIREWNKELDILLDAVKQKKVYDAVNKQLTNFDATPEQIQQYLDTITDLREKIAKAKAGQLTTGANNTNDDNQKELDDLQKYVDTASSIISSLSQAWQSVADSRSRALEQEVTAQQRRVDAAERIAARGNATYLKQEQARLDEVTKKQEEAARRQIAINAAVQASQVLVALATGIARGVAEGGPAGTAIEVAAIIAALAAGFAIVKSLQSNQPSFYRGTEDTGAGGDEDDRKGFKAILHPRERVMTAEQNKHLEGIKNEEVVKIVKSYKRKKKKEEPEYFTGTESASPVKNASHSQKDWQGGSEIGKTSKSFNSKKQALKTLVNEEYENRLYRTAALYKEMGFTKKQSVDLLTAYEKAEKVNRAVNIVNSSSRETQQHVLAKIAKTITPEVLTNFTAQFAPKQLPQVAYDKLEHATKFYMSHDSKMAGIMQDMLKEQKNATDEMKRMHRSLKNLGFTYKMDKDGFETIALNGIKKENIKKKT